MISSILNRVLFLLLDGRNGGGGQDDLIRRWGTAALLAGLNSAD